VLEANGKVNGMGEISHPSPSETLPPIWMPLRIYHYVPQGVDVQNLVKIDLAVAALCMREETRFRVGFFVYISVYPFFSTPTDHIFSTILTLNGSYDVFLQPLVPFVCRDEIAPHLGGGANPQKKHFGGVTRRFQVKLVKSKNMHIIKTTASIATKFCTAIKTTKCPLWVVRTHT